MLSIGEALFYRISGRNTAAAAPKDRVETVGMAKRLRVERKPVS
jgi:hypothetical protein